MRVVSNELPGYRGRGRPEVNAVVSILTMGLVSILKVIARGRLFTRETTNGLSLSA